jgi:hypothetical protein
MTCPDDLLKLQENGVGIFSVQNLHAKVYVFGGRALVGSANVSNHSATTLIEALVQTTERNAVKAARDSVRRLCLQEIGEKALERLQKLYRPPKFLGGGTRRKSATRKIRAEFAPLRLVQLWREEPPKGSESACEQGARIAESKRKRRRTHDLEEFHWSGIGSFQLGESIVQVLDELDGRAKLVSPPGDVISTRRWSNGRRSCLFVYLEVPRRRRIRVNKLANRLGRGAKKALQRGGRVNRDFAERLREAWKR